MPEIRFCSVTYDVHFMPYNLQIKKMEELGIGRPSTYASIMRVLQVA
jgi:reverse gyrase